MRGALKIVMQIGFFIGVSILMDSLVRALHWKVPGSLLGIGVVFLLLQTKIVKVGWIDAGAKWLQAEMLLFFIPSAVGMLQYKSLIAANGVRIMAVIVCSTFAVMACAGLVADRIAKRRGKERV
ncbi:CidA/LrgA family protein [Paenibacillus humicola]|uniref:CidA/LrgA family protein n=1 Tax=Paenibacillus humicola TaxID=3110540 RepID=UPI00237B971B|nr:CidA/LrgA family holin-like protein [Paenibacillus humicola]